MGQGKKPQQEEDSHRIFAWCLIGLIVTIVIMAIIGVIENIGL